MYSFLDTYKSFWSTAPIKDKFHSVSRLNYFLICLLHSMILMLPSYEILLRSPMAFFIQWVIEFIILTLFTPMAMGALGLGVVGAAIAWPIGMTIIDRSNAPLLLSTPYAITQTILIVIRVYIYWKQLQFFNNRSITVAGGRDVGWFPLVKLNVAAGALNVLIPTAIVWINRSKIAKVVLDLLNTSFDTPLKITPEAVWNTFMSIPGAHILLIYYICVLLISLPLGLKNLLSPTSTHTHHDYY